MTTIPDKNEGNINLSDKHCNLEGATYANKYFFITTSLSLETQQKCDTDQQHRLT